MINYNQHVAKLTNCSTGAQVGVDVNAVAGSTKVTANLEHNLSGRVMWNDQNSVVSLGFFHWNYTHSVNQPTKLQWLCTLYYFLTQRISFHDVTACRNANTLARRLAAITQYLLSTKPMFHYCQPQAFHSIMLSNRLTHFSSSYKYILCISVKLIKLTAHLMFKRSLTTN